MAETERSQPLSFLLPAYPMAAHESSPVAWAFDSTSFCVSALTFGIVSFGHYVYWFEIWGKAAKYS
jgi:hypothetical protein